MALDDHGRSQAEAVGRALRAVTLVHLVASPLQRCQETAGIVRDGAWPGMEIHTDERLGECHYGAWTGRSITDLAEEPLWKTVQRNPSAATFPDGDEFPGESLAHMSARVIACVRETDRRVTEEHGPHAVWALVGHGDPIKAVLADASGVHLDGFQRFTASPASVSVIRYAEAHPFVLATNVPASGAPEVIPAPPPDGDAEGGAGGSTTAGGDAVVGGGS